MQPLDDPRLADPAVLRLAVLRLRQRKAQTPDVSTLPELPEGWWQEFWTLLQESPYRRELLACIGVPDTEGPAGVSPGGS